MDTIQTEMAIGLLDLIHKEEKRYSEINKQLQELQGDFATHISPMSENTLGRVVDLLDVILGSEIASYYLYEAVNMKDGGNVIESDGSEWPIRNIDDVRAYVEYLREEETHE